MVAHRSIPLELQHFIFHFGTCLFDRALSLFPDLLSRETVVISLQPNSTTTRVVCHSLLDRHIYGSYSGFVVV